MIINHDRSFVFIEVPRTASRSIRMAIERLSGSENLNCHNTDIPKSVGGYFKWCYTRNPYARLASHYFYRTTVAGNNCFDECRRLSFAEYLDWTWSAKSADERSDVTVLGFLHGIEIDQYLRYEELPGNIASLPFWRPLEAIRLPHLHDSRRNWQEVYDQSSADRVWRWAKEDFAKFGYARDSWRIPVLEGTACH